MDFENLISTLPEHDLLDQLESLRWTPIFDEETHMRCFYNPKDCKQIIFYHHKNKSLVWKYGTKIHRTDGPALIEPKFIRYLIDGKYHRTDGPATIRFNDQICWHQFHMIHRTDGPAVISPNTLSWLENGCQHREDGPAIIERGKRVRWYNEGTFYKVERYHSKYDAEFKKWVPEFHYWNQREKWWLRHLLKKSLF